jgi:antitoxin FitA
MTWEDSRVKNLFALRAYASRATRGACRQVHASPASLLWLWASAGKKMGVHQNIVGSGLRESARFPFNKLNTQTHSIDVDAVIDYNEVNEKESAMAVLTVRNLDPDVKTRLRILAAQQGVSTEEAVRRILTKAANEPQTSPSSPSRIGSEIAALAQSYGGFDLRIQRSQENARPATFD